MTLLEADKEHWYPSYRKVCGPLDRSGQVRDYVARSLDPGRSSP